MEKPVKLTIESTSFGKDAHILNRSQKRLLGQSFWILALAVACFWGFRLSGASGETVTWKQTASSVGSFLWGDQTTIRRKDPAQLLRPGDPVFQADASGQFRQVGTVLEVAGGDPRELMLQWYGGEAPANYQLTQHHSTGSLSEVVATLMPPEKRERIRQRLADVMTRHGEELSRVFVPLVEESLKRSLPVIEQEFRRSVAKHRDEIDVAMERWNREVVDQRLIPLARREILPIVRQHGQEPVETIGREIWDRASLFRFGWRAIYDQTPLPRRDLLQEEWQRFVQDEALPVLNEHMDEVVVAIQRSMRDVAANQAVRDELGAVAQEIANDPASRELIKAILKDTFVQNQRLQQVWAEVWSSERARQALAVASERLEPVIREIGDEIFGSEQTGIDPDFARVLRSQILKKDRRWIIADANAAADDWIHLATGPMAYPLVYLADQD
ncbi:hypothetical protein [Roseiconus nitratireducens]|nr:hypothetical protein [Roseiconus nitratireducens]